MTQTILYDCGHTGHVVLPSKYDGRPSGAGPVPAQELLADTGHAGELRPWNCPACHRKEILGDLRPGLEKSHI